MATTNEIITKVTIDTSGAVNNIGDLTSAIEKNKAEQKELSKQLKELGTRTEENALEYDALSEELVVNKQVTAEMNSERRVSIKNLSVEKGSLAGLKAQLKENNAEREHLNLTTAEGAARADELNAESLELTNTIKEQEEATGNHTRTVGDYGTAFDDLGGSISSVSPAAGKAVQGISGMSTAFKAMLANPVVLMIAAIVLAVQTMLVWFKRTEEGQEELAVITAKLSSYFETFLDVVSSVGKYLFSVLIPVFEAFVDSVMLSFHAIIALGKAMTGDFAGAQESFNKSIESGASMVENLTVATTEAIDNFSVMTKEIEKTTAATEKNSEASQEMARLQAELNKTIRENTVVEGERKLAIAEQILISRDQTKSVQERMQAVENANKLEQEVLASEKAILEEKLLIASTLDGLHDSDIEAKQAVADAERALLDFQTMSVGRQRELLNRKITLQNEEKAMNDKAEAERVAIAKKKADDQAKLEEEEVEAAEKAAELAEEKRLKEIDDLNALNDFKALAKANELEDEIAHADALVLIEQDLLARSLENKELNASEVELLKLESQAKQVQIVKDAEEQIAAIADQAKQDEIARQDKVTSDRQANVQTYLSSSEGMYNVLSQYADKHSLGMKTLAIANATMNTFVAANAALAQTTGGIGVKIAAFSLAIATGLGAVAAIVQTDATIDGGGGGGGGSTPAPVDTGGGGFDTSSIDNQISQEEALQGAFDSMNFQVSVNEINTAQDQIAVVENETTF